LTPARNGAGAAAAAAAPLSANSGVSSPFSIPAALHQAAPNPDAIMQDFHHHAMHFVRTKGVNTLLEEIDKQNLAEYFLNQIGSSRRAREVEFALLEVLVTAHIIHPIIQKQQRGKGSVVSFLQIQPSPNAAAQPRSNVSKKPVWVGHPELRTQAKLFRTLATTCCMAST
jgi:hypothetical protein